ncbi:MAG: hypothetical protein Q9157_005267 [Trypethelium eluteriae]
MEVPVWNHDALKDVKDHVRPCNDVQNQALPEIRTALQLKDECHNGQFARAGCDDTQRQSDPLPPASIDNVLLVQNIAVVADTPGGGNREETGVHSGKDLCTVFE